MMTTSRNVHFRENFDFVFINKLLKLIHLLSKQLVILMVGNWSINSFSSKDIPLF